MAKKKEKMRLLKIGANGNKVTIHGEEDQGGELIQTILVADTPALTEYYDVLSELGKYMAGILEIPKEWTYKCTSVSIKHEEDDRLGATFTLWCDHPKFNSGFVINTPHLREKIRGTAGGGKFMTPKMLELLKDLIKEAYKYLDGKRAQTEMFEEGLKEEPTGEEE